MLGVVNVRRFQVTGLVSVLGLVGCSGSKSDAPEAEAPPRPTLSAPRLKLAEALAAATVISPLTSPTSSLDDPDTDSAGSDPKAPNAGAPDSGKESQPQDADSQEAKARDSGSQDPTEGPEDDANPDPPGTLLTKIDFEDFTEAEFGGQRTPWGAIVDSNSDAGRVLRVLPHRKRPLAYLVGVKPGHMYHVSRQLKGHPGNADVVVLETRAAPAKGSVTASQALQKALPRASMAGSYVNLETLVAQHRFDDPTPAEDFRRDALEIFTQSETRSLVVTFQPAPQPVNRAPVFFDEVRVIALEPTWPQRIDLIRRTYGLPEGPQALRAFGQFLPRPPLSETALEGAFAYRQGVIAPTDTEVAWTVALKPGATLRFGLGLLRESPTAGAARTRVQVDNRTVFDAQISSESGQQWTDHVVDLELTAPQTSEIKLKTVAQSKDAPVVAVWSNPTVHQPTTKTPPNIYLIAIDTLRADRLSTYGHRRPTSPALDALAQDAVVFNQTIAQSNWTPESFASLFTSSYSQQHGVTERLTVLERNEMAHALGQAGYFVQGIAYKLLLYDMGFERGFDDYFNAPRFHLTAGYDIHAEVNWQRAKPWLEQNQKNGPHFLFFHLNDPHQPFNHRGKSIRMFGSWDLLQSQRLRMPILIQKKSVKFGSKSQRCGNCASRGRFTPGFVNLARSLYDGSIAYVDGYLGQFFQTLKDLNLYEEALIVVLSDHGESLADHEDFIGHGFHHMHDPLVRVPFILKPPKSMGIAPRKVPDQVRLLDVMPTLLELVNASTDAPVQGRSLVPLLKGKSMPPVLAVSENAEAKTIAVRSERFKYILRYGLAQEKLYDLARDPAEKTDLARKPVASAQKALVKLRQHAVEHLLATHPGEFIVMQTPPRTKLPGRPLRLKGCPATPQVVVGQPIRRGGFGVKPAAFGTYRAVLKLPPQTRCALLLTSQGSPIAIGTAQDWNKAAARGETTPYVKGKVRIRLVSNAKQVRETKEDVSGEELQALEALGYIQE